MIPVAESAISKDTIVKKFSVTTATNANVSPFGAFGTANNIGAPSGYQIASILIKDAVSSGASINSCVVKINTESTTAMVYSRTASSFEIIVSYSK